AIHRFGNLGPGHAGSDFPGVAKELPDPVDRLFNLKRLFDLHSHEDLLKPRRLLKKGICHADPACGRSICCFLLKTGKSRSFASVRMTSLEISEGCYILHSSSARQNPLCNYSATPFSLRICHTFQGAMGMSMCRTPRCDRASTTALTNAAGEPTFGDSPTPLAPIGWCGDGVQVLSVCQVGVSTEIGRASCRERAETSAVGRIA